MQKRRNSIANALELRLSCTNPLIWDVHGHYINDAVYTHPSIFSMSSTHHAVIDWVCMTSSSEVQES